MSKFLVFALVATFIIGAFSAVGDAQDCAAGYTGDCLTGTGMAGCVEVAAGGTQSMTNCMRCMAGKYKTSANTVAGTCMMCGAGCTTCASGAGKDGSQCFACGAGRYKEAADNTTEAPATGTGACMACMGCANNCVTAATGSATVGLCYAACASNYGNFTATTPVATRSVHANAMYQCGTCTANCTNCAANNNTCATCANGYYLNSNACTACPTNCTACTGATNCTACGNTTTLKNGTCGPAFAGKIFTSVAVVISAALLSLFF